jgi:hypothetical protein
MEDLFKTIEYSSPDLTTVRDLEARIIKKRLQDNLDKILESKKLRSYCKIIVWGDPE